MTGFLEFKKDRIDVSRGPTVTLGEGFDAAFQRAQLVGEITSKAQMEERARKPLADFLPTVSRFWDGSDPAAPQLSDSMKWRLEQEGASISDGTLRELLTFFDANGVEYPDTIRPESLSAALQEERARTVSKVREFDRTLGRAGFAGNVGAFAGEMGAAVDDIETIATLPFGASARAGILATALIEGGINAAAVTATQGDKNDFLLDLGLEPESVAWNAAYAFIGGAAIGGGIKSLEKLGAPFFAAGLRGASSLGRSLRGTSARRALASAAGSDAPPLVRGLARAVERDVEDLEAAVTVQDPAAIREYEERAAIAAEAGHGLVDLDIPDRPAFAVARPSIINGEIEEVDPRALAVQPEVFQFKSEIVAEGGVTPKLLNVKKWMPERAGIVLVYQYADGTRAIADGHQRTALANRIMEADPSQRITMAAKVFKEEDGFTPEDIRVLAALKNISEAADGMTSRMALDAAKVLRISPNAIRELPAGPGIVRARELSALSDEAFDMVINRVVREDFAALVGRMVRDPNMHGPIMKLLAKTDPDSATQAESIISQAMEAPTSQETISDLFGDQVVTESLYLERAKVLERAMRMLRDDRQVFRTLTERSGKIEGAGNRLDGATNKQVRETVEKALVAMKALAHRSGPISEALNDAAKTYRETGKLGQAAERVAAIVRDEIARNGLAGSGIGASRRDAKSPASGATSPDPNEGFSDPVGEAAKLQVEQTRIEPEPAPAPTTAAERAASAVTRFAADAPRQLVDAQQLSPAEFKLMTDQLKDAQPFQTGDELMATMAPLHQALNDQMEIAAREVGVTDWRRAPLKKRDKVDFKVGRKYQGNYRKIADVARTGITIRTMDEADEVVRILSQRFHLIDEGWIRTDAGYFDRKMMVVFDNGALGEVQMWPPGMLEAKGEGGGHNLYDVASDPKTPPAVRDQAIADMRALYGAVLSKLDPSFAERLGVGIDSSASKAAASDGSSSTARSSDSTSLASSAEPPAGIQPSAASNRTASPSGDTAASSAPSNMNTRIGSSYAPDMGSPAPARNVERTAAGDQILMPGVQPITQRERLQARADAPLRAQDRRSDTEIGGLFDPLDPARTDLFDLVPVGRGFDNDGNEVAVVKTREELARELDEEDAFVAEIENCLLGATE